ncbi:uncharacterized protein ASCRUDRAFT_6360 [Ascoidea rubescens DSM 1968]|uniref:Uncharacterized protein n=1 Tax=Ascoidea rubescens DSM 1968 TaxID=1344418 RepID=A0A1D2VSJ7_9ASCO|nr:hypothetical protein ASCRUDRAFT_6360 [Ascoidea rubescens DSM 1968]ODV64569.1 hypothetical protein ASCRUDRAFT_6360 [Ascoidea rubescens DSM 1968]
MIFDWATPESAATDADRFVTQAEALLFHNSSSVSQFFRLFILDQFDAIAFINKNNLNLSNSSNNVNDQDQLNNQLPTETQNDIKNEDQNEDDIKILNLNKIKTISSDQFDLVIDYYLNAANLYYSIESHLLSAINFEKIAILLSNINLIISNNNTNNQTLHYLDNLDLNLQILSHLQNALNSYNLSNAYPDSIRTLKKIIKIYQSFNHNLNQKNNKNLFNKNTNLIAGYNYQIAQLYHLNLKSYQLAISYYTISLDIYLNLFNSTSNFNQTSKIISSYDNISSSYINLNDFLNSAINYKKLIIFLTNNFNSFQLKNTHSNQLNLSVYFLKTSLSFLASDDLVESKKLLNQFCHFNPDFLTSIEFKLINDIFISINLNDLNYYLNSLHSFNNSVSTKNYLNDKLFLKILLKIKSLITTDNLSDDENIL